MTIPTPSVVATNILDYRTRMPNGTMVVRVMLTTPTPRIMAWVAYDDCSTEPLSLYLDEIVAYISDAIPRIAPNDSTIVDRVGRLLSQVTTSQ